MRLLWSIHLYPPYHNCGSEYVAHFVNKFMIAKGHHTRVILHQAKDNNIATPYYYDNVEVFGATGKVDAYRWADVICTHLDYTPFSILMAEAAKKPLIHFVHNDQEYSCVTSAWRNQFIVYNSNWIKNRINYEWPSFVLHPPCEYSYYNVNESPIDNEYITMINLDQNKGGRILQKIASAMPHRKFIGVIGGYSSPAESGQIREQPENVKVIENTDDIRTIYKQTRILLMPSAYESWGRTATEAMCNGIPVICTPTYGLKENCGDAGLYVPARKKSESLRPIEHSDYDLRPIMNHINDLDNENYYKEVSNKCRARALELRPDGELELLEQFFINAVQQCQELQVAI